MSYTPNVPELSEDGSRLLGVNRVGDRLPGGGMGLAIEGGNIGPFYGFSKCQQRLFESTKTAWARRRPTGSLRRDQSSFA